MTPYCWRVFSLPFTIGLSGFIATLEILHARTGRDRYARLSKLWTKVFAVSFGMGVVSGIGDAGYH